MIIRSVEPRPQTHFYWLIQWLLLLMLVGAMVIASAALGSPGVIRSLLKIGTAGAPAVMPRESLGVDICSLRPRRWQCWWKSWN